MFNLKMIFDECCRIAESHLEDLEVDPLVPVVHLYQQYLINQYTSILHLVGLSLRADSTISEGAFNRTFESFSAVILQLVIHLRLLSHDAIYLGLQKQKLRYVEILKQQGWTYQEVIWDLRVEEKKIGFWIESGQVTICRFQDGDLERVDYKEPLDNSLPEMRNEIEELKKLNAKFVKLVGEVDSFKAFDRKIPFI